MKRTTSSRPKNSGDPVLSGVPTTYGFGIGMKSPPVTSRWTTSAKFSTWSGPRGSVYSSTKRARKWSVSGGRWGRTRSCTWVSSPGASRSTWAPSSRMVKSSEGARLTRNSRAAPRPWLCRLNASETMSPCQVWRVSRRQTIRALVCSSLIVLVMVTSQLPEICSSTGWSALPRSVRARWAMWRKPLTARARYASLSVGASTRSAECSASATGSNSRSTCVSPAR